MIRFGLILICSFAGTPAPTADTGQALCSADIDCDGFCRDRGDGVRVCMADGLPGDYCASTLDCDESYCIASAGHRRVCGPAL